jgi:uncharacterized membrane protein YdjX (TVP38/TMEM64 family)
MRWLKRALLVGALVALGWLGHSVWDHDALMGWIGRASPIPFFALMSLLPAVGVPITPFFVVAGATFGARLGVIGSWVAISVNFALCYFLARTMRPSVETLFRRFGHPLPPVRTGGRSALRFSLALKLAPGVPQVVKSWGLGLAKVPFAICFPVTLLVTGVYAALLILLGESLFRHERTRALVVAAIVAGVAVGLWALLRWRRKPSPASPASGGSARSHLQTPAARPLRPTRG